jgi:hypothetical protein
MADRFLFEPLDIVQLAVPSIDNIDIDLTARNIRIFRASGSKRSYNPVVAHAEGFASGATSLELALAGLTPFSRTGGNAIFVLELKDSMLCLLTMVRRGFLLAVSR